MARQNRTDLKGAFSNGSRPSGPDFANLIDSFINPEDDSIKRDAGGNFTITLGNVANAQAGTLRFNANKVQFFDGAVWQDVGSGSGGGFQPVAGGANIAYNAGNVGVGLGNGVQPTAKLDIGLAAGEQIKIGNASLANGSAAFQNTAVFSHNQRANNSDFAIRQNPTGEVRVNAPTNQRLTLSKGGNQVGLSVIENGNVVVGAEVDLGTNTKFQVNGGASKNDGSPNWVVASDMRLKKDILPFKDGLSKLMQINPVTFKYNGKGNMQPDKEQVGIIGQEIEKVLPYTVSKSQTTIEKEEAPTDVLFFDPNALVYVLINAVKELSEKVQDLQKQLNPA